jgi:hypothetical protein
MVPLPLEILSEILKNLTLHECNRVALKKCSLICSTWHTIVRPWICASIALYFEPPPYRRLVRTQEVLSASPCVAVYVRTLSITRSYYRPRIGVEGIAAQLRAMDEQGIITKLSGHVRCLILDFENYDYYADEIKEVFNDYLARFSSVQHLHLSRAIVPSYALLKSTFPFVHRLSLDRVYFKEPFHLGDKSIQRIHISTTVNSPVNHLPIPLPSDREDRVTPLIHVSLNWTSTDTADARPVGIEGDIPWKLVDAIPTTLKSLTLHGKEGIFARHLGQPDHEDQVLRELSASACYFYGLTCMQLT